MTRIIVKTFDGEVVGMLRQEPQTTTLPPRWIATAYSVGQSMPFATIFGAVDYLEGRAWVPAGAPTPHPPLSPEAFHGGDGHRMLTLTLPRPT